MSIAIVISLISGGADIAWAIGSARLLYVKVVPSDKRAEYMAVYYASIGLIGGLSQLFGGGALDYTQHLSGQFLIFPLDPFFPLFVFGIVLTIISAVLFNRVQPDSPVSLGEFAGLFIHGNPVLALESVFRYYRARDERQTVAMTERLGQTKSPLTVEELLESLKDPRFNVRFEAVISISRMESDPRLVEALSQIVDGTELSLSVIAAWALGRIGDERAIVSLRRGLDSQYRSIQAHCARSLGTLGDTTVIPLLLERLKTETDKGLRVAYSSALGKLRSTDSIEIILNILLNTENEGARLEIALALARIVGYEHHFIRLLRQVRHDKGTATSQAVTIIKRHLGEIGDELRRALIDCADAFAREDFDQAVSSLVQVIRLLLPDLEPLSCKIILEDCVLHLETFKTSRMDYVLLALHALDIAVS